MIAVKIQGGLGNQMFQFAAAYANAGKVYLDLDFLRTHNVSTDTFTKREFELLLFPNLEYRELPAFRKKLFHSKGKLYKLLRGILRARIIKQEENEFVHIGPKKNRYLDGYFQSEKYFRHAEADIRRLFAFPELDGPNQRLKDRILQAENSVSLHIRRGDYLKPEVVKYHGLLPLAYYREALALVSEKVGKVQVFVFSDDTAFVRDNFGQEPNLTIVDGNGQENAWKDMALMASCRHHVIANSSFSWWGAWLSGRESGITIAPKNWFNPEVARYDIDDFIPKEWLKT